MDSLEINKAVAAFLMAGIAFMGAQLISEALVHPTPIKGTAIKVDLPGEQTAAAAPAEAEPPIATLLASADPARGEAGVKNAGCVACHSFNEGGKAGVGPNLYGVIGGPHGHMQGYEYSAALKGKPGNWDFEAMNEWLKKPSAYAPGTKMSYAGLSDPKKRADIIDYLRTLAKDPVPLPAAPAQQASASAPAAPPQAGASALAVPPAGAPGAVAAASPNPAPAPAGTPAGGGDINVLLASADADAGKSAATKLGCIACHSFNEGGKAGVGPNLYGIIGAPHGHQEGFAYSAALKGKEGPWTYAEMDKWLLKPSAYAPGTKMSFAGIANPKVRADVIAYLRSLSAHPEPLPAGDAPKQPG
jgi:cytochrome c